MRSGDRYQRLDLGRSVGPLDLYDLLESYIDDFGPQLLRVDAPASKTGRRHRVPSR